MVSYEIKGSPFKRMKTVIVNENGQNFKHIYNNKSYIKTLTKRIE